MASIYRALGAYEKAQAYPEAVEQARTEHAQRVGGTPAVVRPRPGRAHDTGNQALHTRPAQLPPDSRPGPPTVDQYDQLLTRSPGT